MKSWQNFSCEGLVPTWRHFLSNSRMRFSRAQITGALMLLALIWLVIAIRLIISRR